jgi:hypothetical protein
VNDFLPFPDDMFPCTTTIRTYGDVKNPTGGSKRVVTGEVTLPGNVQEACFDLSWCVYCLRME